jgi:Tfp pilus assembly protein PilF
MQAEVFENLGIILANCGELQQAMEHLEQALAVRRELVIKGVGLRVEYYRVI